MSAGLDPSRLVIPITPNGNKADLTESSCSSATPSCLVSWGLQQASEGTYNAGGVAFGCKDGSVFVLRSTGSTSVLAASSPPLEPLTSPINTRRHLSLGRHPPSRSASPSSTKSSLSPFHVTRSRVVSSVNTEQAEAPKNYVDFEDEQEKLKGMLKGKGHRERHASTSRTRAEAIAERLSLVQGAPTQGSNLRKDDTRSYLSSALSPTSSTLSLSTSSPPSPTLLPATSPEPGSSSPLSLRCHFFPPHAGPSRAVSSLKVHGDGKYVTCLSEAGGLSVHSVLDGTCLASTVVEATCKVNTVGGKAQAAPPMLWVWRCLLVAASEESILLFACASPDELYPASQAQDAGTDTDNVCLIAAYELSLRPNPRGDGASLEYMGQWSLDASLETIGLRAEEDHSLTLFYATSSGHLVSRSLTMNDHPPSPSSDLPESHSSTHLPLPNPFKVLKSLSTDHIPDTVKETPPEGIILGEEVHNGDLGVTSPLSGLKAHNNGKDVRLCAWSTDQMMVTKWAGSSLDKPFVATAIGIHDMRWIDHDSFSVAFPDRVEVHRVSFTSEGGTDKLQVQLSHSVPYTAGDASTIVQGGHIVYTHVKHSRRRVYFTSVSSPKSDRSGNAVTLWKARKEPTGEVKPGRRISSVLPLDMESIVIGYSDGHLARVSFLEFSRGSCAPSQTSDMPLPGAVVSMDVVLNARTGERVLVGGADDGTIAIWTLDTLKVCARWTLFTTPLARVMALLDEKVGRLHGCVLCVSQDGTIAVVAVDGYQFVYLVPAAAAPLARICLGENNLLLTYRDGRARLWDTRTREFWRSMSVDKSEEMMSEGGWLQWNMDGVPDYRTVLWSLSHPSADAASTLLLDVSTLLRQFSSSAALTGQDGPGLSVKAKLGYARAVLSVLLTFGVSEGIDAICTDGLSIAPSPASIGLAISNGLSLLHHSLPPSVWTASPEASADRALAILAMLQFLTQFEDLAQDASTVMTFYAASVGQLVHDSYQPPSLPRLGHYLLHTLSTDVRHAARLLFDAGVARLSDQETAETVEAWQQYLPSLRPEKERDWTNSALALCICGFIAVDKYSLLPTSTLTDIAKSIAGYLHDETSPHRSLAIDLCSRGFQVWQQYVDAVEMLRALFTLATSAKKEAIAVPNIGVQARTAVLQIAASNTPLFMTTLAIDILHPRSVQHRKSVMQLVIFLIRKKPLVLYGNLPRLVEAIVKSLDPNSNATREAVLDSATEILSHIVQTFPTVDFHMGSQRLAVGTSEGAVVMYDLKTATRLYVLEGHKKRAAACSFSPDGRRLVTVSLEESSVLVWKVGSSFSSFFMPGAPPRQGHSGSEPFKTLSFNVGDEANMTLESTLVNVRFDWTADRNVKLKIKDSILTFST